VNTKRWICVVMAALLCTVLFGCSKKVKPQSSVAPAPTLAPNDNLSIAGKVELKLNGNSYVATCTSDIPEGALVTIYLMDDTGNMLDSTSDVIQKNGQTTASFDKEDADATAKENKAQGIMARVEFYPSASTQPSEVKEKLEKFGSKGSKLAGDNTIVDSTTGEIGVRMESTEFNLQ